MARRGRGRDGRGDRLRTREAVGPQAPRNAVRTRVTLERQPALVGVVHTRVNRVSTRRQETAPPPPDQVAGKIDQFDRDRIKQQAKVSGLDVTEKRRCKKRPDSRVNRGKGKGRPFVPYCKG